MEDKEAAIQEVWTAQVNEGTGVERETTYAEEAVVDKHEVEETGTEEEVGQID